VRDAAIAKAEQGNHQATNSMLIENPYQPSPLDTIYGSSIVELEGQYKMRFADP